MSLPEGSGHSSTGRSELFSSQGLWQRAQIAVQDLVANERKILVENGADARYTESGHLIYARFATLMAAPFDLDRLELTGGSVAMLEGVSQALNMGHSGFDTGALRFTVSGAGTLAYLSGGIRPER